jgi:hypothetical protein
MIDSQHAGDKVAKILLDNHALDLIEENKRLKREANMSVTGTGGVPLYFNNGNSYKDGPSPHEWYCTWETRSGAWMCPQNKRYTYQGN